VHTQAHRAVLAVRTHAHRVPTADQPTGAVVPAPAATTLQAPSAACVFSRPATVHVRLPTVHDAVQGAVGALGGGAGGGAGEGDGAGAWSNLQQLGAAVRGDVLRQLDDVPRPAVTVNNTHVNASAHAPGAAKHSDKAHGCSSTNERTNHSGDGAQRKAAA
jgi:hypothetical protein